jgi:general secretion pathway protein K
MLTIKKQHGAAIIVALFVTSLVAIAAIAMIVRLRGDVHRIELILNATQANLYAKGSVDWAIEQLNKNLKDSHLQPNKLIDSIPIRSPIQTLNGMTISSTIYDAQARFNVNNLINTQNKPDFVKLILTVYPKISASDADNLAIAVMNWVSMNALSNTLNDYYLKLNPPYRAPHRPIQSISELRLVKGMTPELFHALSRYITALPEVTPININTASAPVLMTASSTLPLASAKTLALQARANPFTDTAKFWSLDIVKSNSFVANKITIVSHYFLVRTDVKVGEQRLVLYTLLQRKEGSGPAGPSETVLWQSKGTL